MNIETNGKLVIFNDMTYEDMLGGSFKNFAGEKRVCKNGPYAGKTMNKEGERNFCIIIPDDAIGFFQQNNIKIGEFGGNPDEGEPPIHYVKVNVNFKVSANFKGEPPQIYLIKSTGRMEPMPESSVAKIDGMNVEYARVVTRMWTGTERTSLWLQSGEFKPQYDPITEKYNMQMELNGLDPTIPEEEIPFGEE